MALRLAQTILEEARGLRRPKNEQEEDEKPKASKFSRQRQMRRFFDHHVRLDVSAFFAARDPHFLRALGEELQVELFIPGQTILVEGEIGDAMYFLNRGTVEVLVGGGKVKVAELPEGVVFGEMAVISGTGKRMATIRALELCDCRVIQRSDFVRILNHFPAERRHYEEMGNKRVEEAKAKSISSRRYVNVKVPGGRRSPSPLHLSKLKKASKRSSALGKESIRSPSSPDSGSTSRCFPADSTCTADAEGADRTTTSGEALQACKATAAMVEIDAAQERRKEQAEADASKPSRLPRIRSMSPHSRPPQDSGHRTLSSPRQNSHLSRAKRGLWKSPPCSARNARDDLPQIQDQGGVFVLPEKELATEIVETVLASALTPRGTAAATRKPKVAGDLPNPRSGVDSARKAGQGAEQLGSLRPATATGIERIEALLGSPLNVQQAKGSKRQMLIPLQGPSSSPRSQKGKPPLGIFQELDLEKDPGAQNQSEEKPKACLGMWWLPDVFAGVSPPADQHASDGAILKNVPDRGLGASLNSACRKGTSEKQPLDRQGVQGTYIVTSWLVQ